MLCFVGEGIIGIFNCTPSEKSPCSWNKRKMSQNQCLPCQDQVEKKMPILYSMDKFGLYLLDCGLVCSHWRKYFFLFSNLIICKYPPPVPTYVSISELQKNLVSMDDVRWNQWTMNPLTLTFEFSTMPSFALHPCLSRDPQGLWVWCLPFLTSVSSSVSLSHLICLPTVYLVRHVVRTSTSSLFPSPLSLLISISLSWRTGWKCAHFDSLSN